jgi:hypothetical protein
MRARPQATSRLDNVSRGLLALVALANVWAGGCSKDTLYTYVSVHVVVDSTISDVQLFQISGCEFQVSGAETSSARSLNCPPTAVHRDVGTFEWSTQVKTGTLQFEVQIFDPNRVVIGQGTSDEIAVAPGKHLTTTVNVVAVGAPGTDAGTTTDAPTEGGGDTESATDAGVGDAADGSSDGASDGASDGNNDTAADAGADRAADTVPAPDGASDG